MPAVMRILFIMLHNIQRKIHVKLIKYSITSWQTLTTIYEYADCQ